MYTYNKVTFKNSKTLCTLLGFDRVHFLNYQRKHKIPFSKMIDTYIKHFRFKTRGLIFTNIRSACESWGCPYQKAKPFLEKGYCIELACFMGLNDYPLNFFEVLENDNKKKRKSRKSKGATQNKHKRTL